MNKDLLEDEIEFPDEIIAFLKIKYAKAYTDQEKGVLKQIEQLTEEKKELKEIISKRKEQTKFKSLPIDIIPSEEAKEKAIKLVQDGTLLLSSKSKSIESDDLADENHSNATSSQKIKSRQNEKIESLNSPKASLASKISFVSAGYAFTEEQPKHTEDISEQTLKRSLSLSSNTEQQNISKKFRHASENSSDSEEQDKSTLEKNSESRSMNSTTLRFCGHNMQEDFVRRIIEPYGPALSVEIEERHDNSANVLVTFENQEMARVAREALDSQFLEGRVVSVYFKREGSEFSARRPHRRRRFREFRRGTRGGQPFSFPRSNTIEHDTMLPSHFYTGVTSGRVTNNNTDVDEATPHRTRWTVNEDSDVNDSTNKIGASETPKTQYDRTMVIYDDLDPL